jgi:acetylornithine deacetylase
MTSVASIALQLCRIESTSGSEADVIAEAERLLLADSWRCFRIPVTPGRDNLLATWSDEPCVTLSTHLDTVPPFIPPTLEGSTLRGRGSCDAKGIAASMIVAAGQMRAAGLPVALLFVVGEETAHDGAHAANEWARSRGFRSRALINGEPTDNRLAAGTKGALRFTLQCEGIAAHSAYPELGRSATSALARLIVEMEQLDLPYDDLLGQTTINVGFVSGGVADNVIAPLAEARCMARIVGPAEDLESRLRSWLNGRAVLSPGVTVPAVRLGVIDGFESCVVSFATDIPELDAWGKPFLLGPGSIHVAHTDDEHIEVDDLEKAVELYVKLAGRL